MKTYRKHISNFGMMLVSVTALVVATQSGSAKEVHSVASYHPNEMVSNNSAIANTTQSLLASRHISILSNEQENMIKKEKTQRHSELMTMAQIQKQEEIQKERFKKEQIRREAEQRTIEDRKKQANLQAKERNKKENHKFAQDKVVKSAIRPPAPSVPAKKSTIKVSQSLSLRTSTQTSANDSFYVKAIPLPYAHQKYLYEMTKKRGLDYHETLAFLHHESNSNPKAKGGESYGYFQVHKVNHKSLASKLKTKVAPFDPYVNINWGTYMIYELNKKYKAKGLSGTSLKEAVLSAYNKGEGGYARTGKAVAYIKKHNEVLSFIKKNS